MDEAIGQWHRAVEPDSEDMPEGQANAERFEMWPLVREFSGEGDCLELTSRRPDDAQPKLLDVPRPRIVAQGVDHGIRQTRNIQLLVRVGNILFGDGIPSRKKVRVRAHPGRVATRGCWRPCP